MIAYQTLLKGDIVARSQRKEGTVYRNPIVITPGDVTLILNLVFYLKSYLLLEFKRI
jgi:hypothetical protein